MKIEAIIGEHGKLPQLCNGGGCPAVILNANGDLFVQGYLPAEDEQQNLPAPAGEGFVRMSRATFEKIARQLLAP